MLQSSDGTEQEPAVIARRRSQALRLHTGITVAVLTLLVIVWALTGGPFWPIWPALALGLLLGIHASIAYAAGHPDLVRRYGLTTAAAANVGVTTTFSLFYVFVWIAAGGGYFWPVWPILGLGLILFVQVLVVRSQRAGREELEERIETLETTRAGAVDVQETELRRIERDLHDGAQARLVALGMNLGMAEQKLGADPDAARELVSEARVGIEEALRELRDLARGIHPPVLTDRGLEAAISALADQSAIPVSVSADVPERPAATIETAAYFVAAEALTNAAKHAGASKVEVRVVRRPKSLVVEVSDDGHGGADPSGSGLTGLRRRVEALDGTLYVFSPPDGGTTLRAELPCAS
jgi:signal transduction histidine kinase